MTLTPGDRRLLGKRAAEKVEALGLVLVDARALERLRELASRTLDVEGKDAQISVLMRQVIERGEALSEARADARRWAEAYLAARQGRCRACGREAGR